MAEFPHYTPPYFYDFIYLYNNRYLCSFPGIIPDEKDIAWRNKHYEIHLFSNYTD